MEEGYFWRETVIEGRNKLRSCARHESGQLKMKKLVLSLAIVAVCSAAVVSLCSFSSEASATTVSATPVHTHFHSPSQGAHCSGSVGCDCPGFSPITNGKEWQKSYCRHCGHKKSSHR